MDTQLVVKKQRWRMPVEEDDDSYYYTRKKQKRRARVDKEQVAKAPFWVLFNGWQS